MLFVKVTKSSNTFLANCAHLAFSPPHVPVSLDWQQVASSKVKDHTEVIYSGALPFKTTLGTKKQCSLVSCQVMKAACPVLELSASLLNCWILWVVTPSVRI